MGKITVQEIRDMLQDSNRLIFDDEIQKSLKKMVIPVMWPHQESNLDLKFRKLLFYPLNYEAVEQNKITN